jgi:hypothetical protein
MARNVKRAPRRRPDRRNLERQRPERRNPERRAQAMKNLVNQSVAVQVELLGAAVQVWSAMFESLATYTRIASGEVLGISMGGDANAALDKIITTAQGRLDQLTKLPEEIGREFEQRVRARHKR